MVQYRIQQAIKTWFQKFPKAYFDVCEKVPTFATNKVNMLADVCYFIGENTPIMTGGSQSRIT